MGERVLTANLLREGLVVFLTDDDSWTASIDDAAIVSDDEQAAALEARAARHIAEDHVVDAYLIDVERIDGRIKASHIRERIRTLGPTVHLDHGKQAEGTAGAFGPDDGSGQAASAGARAARGERRKKA